jgi:hypothetical protein
MPPTGEVQLSFDEGSCEVLAMRAVRRGEQGCAPSDQDEDGIHVIA